MALTACSTNPAPVNRAPSSIGVTRNIPAAIYLKAFPRTTLYHLQFRSHVSDYSFGQPSGGFFLASDAFIARFQSPLIFKAAAFGPGLAFGFLFVFCIRPVLVYDGFCGRGSGGGGGGGGGILIGGQSPFRTSSSSFIVMP